MERSYMKSKLVAFIKNNFKNHDVCLNIIMNSNVSVLVMSDLQDYKDKRYFNVSTITMINQKYRNQVFFLKHLFQQL